ncbi:MAG TPA: MarR family transcriptional regulator [Candidatus Limnocylindrales bacterium]|nr:MarR family transcriptional regulator [Candidatus Limnocylindrales bacterium]
MTPDLMMLLHVASHGLETELAARLAELGITPRGRCVLAAAAGGELTQTELAERCNLDKTTMVVTMDTLEKAGLAERRTSSTDRRARIIAVTEAGRKMVDESERVVAEIYDDVLKSLPGNESDAFLRGLRRLAEGRLGQPTPCEKPPRRRAVKPPAIVR